MPPLPPVPSVTKITAGGHMSGVPWATNWFIQRDTSTGLTLLELDALLSDPTHGLVQYWQSTLAHVFGTNVTSEYIRVKDLDPAGGLSSEGPFSQVGGRTGPTPTNAACTLIKEVIARAYRGGHPRTYLPGGGQADLADPRTWNTTFTNIVNTNLGNWINGMLDAHVHALTITGPTYVSVSYYTGHGLRTSPHVDPIVASSVETAIASQRRRMGR